MSELSELLTQAKNAEDLGVREIARRANQRGYTLAPGTVSRYLRGEHGEPDEDTLAALHEVLHVPLEDLRTAAGLPAGIDEPYEPPAEAARLDRRQRAAVSEIIRLLAHGEDEGHVCSPPNRRTPVSGVQTSDAVSSESLRLEEEAKRRSRRDPPETDPA